MSFRELVFLMILCVAVSGCKTYPLRESVQIPPGDHILIKPYIPELNEAGLFQLSCTDKYPNGESAYAVFDKDKAPTSRAELAKRHFMHAAMASNAYLSPKVKPIFRLPGWTLLEGKESDTGLGLQVYGDEGTVDASRHLVVVYRGTDSTSLKDWGNNLALREPPQYRQAYSHLFALREAHPKTEITAVGHSLGGGIALNMSLRVPRINAVAFNTSPRIRFGNARALPAYRASLYEVGEILTGTTGFFSYRELPESTNFGNYNFLDYRTISFSPVAEHGIYEMARALTVVAMNRGSEEAREFFRVNIGEDQARRVDWEHCKAIFASGKAGDAKTLASDQ